MERQELERRIENKKVEIAKKEKNLVKYIVDDEFTAICDRFFETNDRTELNQYKEHHNLYWLPDYYSKRYELEEAKKTLAKYQVQLDKLTNFENEEKIEALWTFLCDWETKAYNWYLENCKHYFELKKEFNNAKAIWKKEYLEKHPKPSEEDRDAYRNWDRDYMWYKKRWIEKYYEDINTLTVDLTSVRGHYGEYDEHYNREYILDTYTVDTEKLAKYLREEKSRKYQDLVKRITAVVGEIQDAKGLSIGKQNGEINGVVVGSKGSARVETISASGPVQCFHYRVLVHLIK